jgi:nucleoid DNA-binding protein/cell division septation protein DedD
MKIGTYISQLLLLGHESVILPGFGEFYTKYSPAKFVPEEKKVESPSKTIAFNQDLKEGDTPLIAFMATKEELSIAQVQNYLANFVSEIDNQINQGKKVVLDKIGIFSALQDGQIRFDPDRSINYLSQAIGIGAITEPPTIEKISGVATDSAEAKETPDTASPVPFPPTTAKEQTEHTETATSVMENEQRPQLPRAIKWIAFTVIPILIIIIILALNYNFFFVSKKDKSPKAVSQTELAPPASSPAAAETAIESGSATDQAGTPATTQQAATPQQAATTQQNVAQQAPTASQAQRPPAPEAGRKVYYIVVGSFPNETQAEELAQRLRNQGAGLATVFMKTGFNYHRVCYGYYYDLPEAEALLPTVQQSVNPDAYILHR